MKTFLLIVVARTNLEGSKPAAPTRSRRQGGLCYTPRAIAAGAGLRCGRLNDSALFSHRDRVRHGGHDKAGQGPPRNNGAAAAAPCPAANVARVRRRRGPDTPLCCTYVRTNRSTQCPDLI